MIPEFGQVFLIGALLVIPAAAARPLVRTPEAMAVVEARAHAVGARLVRLGADRAEAASSDADRLVTRDETVDVVCGGRSVSESAISARIAAARKAVGDDGKRQAVIATVAPSTATELTMPRSTMLRCSSGSSTGRSASMTCSSVPSGLRCRQRLMSSSCRNAPLPAVAQQPPRQAEQAVSSTSC